MKIFISTILIILLGLLGYFLFTGKGTVPTGDVQERGKREAVTENELPSFKDVDFSKFNPVFRFAGDIPIDWEVTQIPELQAINIYDSSVSSGEKFSPEGMREKSQIYISSFEANRFLTLSTVEVISQDQTVIRGHDAVLYEIAKKSGVPDFLRQPDWRNFRHKALDTRFTKNSPSMFYSFAYNPKLSEETFNSFINSLVFHNDKESFRPPLARISERVIKKPFGLRVSPQDSPVQPEFFTGYHTAIDYEIFDTEANTDVSVFAICGGQLRVRRKATGYGGVAVQDCLIEDSFVTIIYGHLFLDSIAKDIGSYLAPGDIIGNLGAEGEEAGGGRKHLHLGIHRGSEVDIRGYVDIESELANWLDPVSIF